MEASHGCTQCGADYIIINTTPEILANTEGGLEFAETVRSFGGNPDEIEVGFCPHCKENIMFGPTVTIEGTIQ